MEEVNPNNNIINSLRQSYFASLDWNNGGKERAKLRATELLIKECKKRGIINYTIIEQQ